MCGSEKGPLQDHTIGSYTGCSENGPFQEYHTSSKTTINVPNGPYQDNTTLDPLVYPMGPYQGSIYAEPPVCNPNCHFQGYLNIVPTPQSSNNVQTLTLQIQHVSEPAVANYIDPSQDHLTVISSVCFQNYPFHGLLNSVPMSTSQNLKSGAVPREDAHNGPSHANHTSLESLTSRISQSQGNLNNNNNNICLKSNIQTSSVDYAPYEHWNLRDSFRYQSQQWQLKSALPREHICRASYV